MENAIKIESNIPLPRAAYKNSFPFTSMKKGDSFFVPSSIMSSAMVRTYACAFARANKGCKFTTRKTYNPEGCRTWRIK